LARPPSVYAIKSKTTRANTKRIRLKRNVREFRNASASPSIGVDRHRRASKAAKKAHLYSRRRVYFAGYVYRRRQQTMRYPYVSIRVADGRNNRRLFTNRTRSYERTLLAAGRSVYIESGRSAETNHQVRQITDRPTDRPSAEEDGIRWLGPIPVRPRSVVVVTNAYYQYATVINKYIRISMQALAVPDLQWVSLPRDSIIKGGPSRN